MSKPGKYAKLGRFVNVVMTIALMLIAAVLGATVRAYFRTP